MRTQTINFPDQQTLCVFPTDRSNLEKAISELAWVKPASKSEKNKRVIESILRWADDGGPVSETGNPLRHVGSGDKHSPADGCGRIVFTGDKNENPCDRIKLG